MMQKKITCAFFLLITLLVIPASAEELIVGLQYAGYPPYSFPETSNKKGIFLDILDEISKQTGDKFVIKYYPAKRRHLFFENGGIDIESGVNPAWRKKWENISVYSIPFAISSDVVFFRKGESFPVTDSDDLTGKKIATIRGYFYPIFEEVFKNRTIIRKDLNNELQLVKFLYYRDADAGFINKTVLEYYVAKYNMEFDVGNIIGSVPIMFRFHISKKHVAGRFNKALKTLLEDGKIEAIFNKYK